MHARRADRTTDPAKVNGRFRFREPPSYGSTRPCRVCGQLIRFRLAESGSYLPEDPNGGWHWIYCHGQLPLGLAS